VGASSSESPLAGHCLPSRQVFMESGDGDGDGDCTYLLACTDLEDDFFKLPKGAWAPLGV